MTLKAILAAAAALAIAVGLAIPAPHAGAAPKTSQIASFEIGHG
jgi:hypothetical protein